MARDTTGIMIRNMIKVTYIERIGFEATISSIHPWPERPRPGLRVCRKWTWLSTFSSGPAGRCMSTRFSSALNNGTASRWTVNRWCPPWSRRSSAESRVRFSLQAWNLPTAFLPQTPRKRKSTLLRQNQLRGELRVRRGGFSQSQSAVVATGPPSLYPAGRAHRSGHSTRQRQI